MISWGGFATIAQVEGDDRRVMIDDDVLVDQTEVARKKLNKEKEIVTHHLISMWTFLSGLKVVEKNRMKVKFHKKTSDDQLRQFYR